MLLIVLDVSNEEGGLDFLFLRVRGGFDDSRGGAPRRSGVLCGDVREQLVQQLLFLRGKVGSVVAAVIEGHSWSVSVGIGRACLL